MILTKNEQQALLKSLEEMSSVFWGPDLKKCTQLLQKPFWSSLDKLAAQYGAGRFEALNEIKSVLQEFRNPEALFHHLEEGYVRLFISDREGITAPLYESCYVSIETGEKKLLMGAPAIDMHNRYESKGLSLSEEIHEPPDHLSIELEYLYFLLEKGWADGDKELLTEASAFSAEIMLPWLSKFQARLAVEKKCRFYPLMASMLTAILEIIAGSNHHLEKD
jgi:TorA-specific chaperone